MTEQAVIDASVCAGWVLRDEATDASWALLDEVLNGTVQLVVPELWHYEMLSLMRTAVLDGRLEQEEAGSVLSSLENAPLEMIPPSVQGPRSILAAAVQLGLSVYDAAYFTLAQGRGIPLVTADSHLLRLRAQFPWVRSLEEFSRRREDTA